MLLQVLECNQVEPKDKVERKNYNPEKGCRIFRYARCPDFGLASCHCRKQGCIVRHNKFAQCQSAMKQHPVLA